VSCTTNEERDSNTAKEVKDITKEVKDTTNEERDSNTAKEVKDIQRRR
jgi:hypothetical protein